MSMRPSSAFASQPRRRTGHPKPSNQTMPLLASGALRLRRQRKLPMKDAAKAHRLLESGEVREKLVLEAE